MNRPIRSFRHQHGQVAVIVAIVIGLLILMVGLVVDLGYLYTRKTELQNASDAAALAGAKELNGTAAGITAAKNKAVELAGANSVDFGSKAIVIDETNIWFANTPDGNDTNNDGKGDGTWTSFADASASDTAAADKRFILVDTSGIGLSTVQTWFMRVAQWGFGGIETTSTFGRAVAGPNKVDLTPIAACALDQDDCPPNGTGNCGYELGKAYKLGDVNPLGPGNFYLLNPVATDDSPGACAQITGTDFIRPFICQGVVAAPVAAASQVLTRPGTVTPALAALDSRFDDYNPQAQCDPATAPPDVNIKQFLYTDPNVAAWMTPQPTQQASQVTDRSGTPLEIDTDYNGVVWSFVRPPVGTPGPAEIPTGTTFATGRTVVDANYPDSGTPYTQTSGNFFDDPTRTGKPERRVLTLAIIACPTAGGNCALAPVLARGRFLMQREAHSPANDRDIYVEYGGTIGVAGITAQYKLYR